jgi:hypothetical protein
MRFYKDELGPIFNFKNINNVLNLDRLTLQLTSTTINSTPRISAVVDY